MKLRSLFSILSLIVLATACNNQRGNNKSHGPIVLGDSSTIVTDNDPEHLKDGVADLHVPDNNNEEATQSSGTDTTGTNTVAEQPANNGNGLSAAFKEVTIFLPNINARQSGKTDLSKARSATYTLAGGNLAGSALRISGGTINKVSQRTQTVIALQDGNDKLVLDNLGATSAWEPLQGSSGNYPLTSLASPELDFKNARPAEIRNAVQQAARRARLTRQETQDWVEAARNMNAANQAPGTVVLKSVSWRIEGKDAKGRSFTKEIRIDIP